MEIERLKHLAISDSGFIFDPGTGHSYTSNDIGLFIIAILKTGADPACIIGQLVAEYEVTSDEAERDVQEFIDSLKKLALL